MHNGKYWIENNCICMHTKEESCQLTNFAAWIVEENRFHDGRDVSTWLKISGKMGCEENDDLVELPIIEVRADEFPSMNWVADKWGMAPIIYPAPSAERNLRTAIQVMSSPAKRDIYTHTGWTEINKERVYLSATGGIGKSGHKPDITVRLPHELSNYALPKPIKSREAFAASASLPGIGPPAVTVPLLLAAYRAAMGPTDFAIHLAGRTGTFKSELTSLIQSHFGAGMDARHLPASWSSTANALEALAYKAANAIMVIDDFVPLGTAWQVRGLQKTADQIIRAQGNQAGRSRMTDISSLQTTFYPRGLIVSTGEDIPEGHSVRARMLILELAPGDIEPKNLTRAQQQRNLFPQAMADWIQWLAEKDRRVQHRELARQARDGHLDIGHSRTPPIFGELLATAHLLTEYAQERGFLDDKTAAKVRNNAGAALLDAAKAQEAMLTAADPVTGLLETIATVLASQVCHVKTRNGGIPVDAEKWGWTRQQSAGEMPTWKSNGPRLGWVDQDAGELLLDQSCLVLLKKYSGGKLAVTPQTLLKRLKEAGILSRTNEAQQRNTVKVTCEGHQRPVLAISLEQMEGN